MKHLYFNRIAIENSSAYYHWSNLTLHFKYFLLMTNRYIIYIPVKFQNNPGPADFDSLCAN